MALIIDVAHAVPQVVVTLAKAKKQMRFDDADAAHLEDELIQVYIEAAVKKAENFIDSEITEKKYEIRGKSFADVLTFSRQKIQKVTAVTFKDTAGASQTINAEDYHLSTIDKYENKFSFNEDFELPEVKPYTPDAVSLFVTVGYPSGKVPKDMQVAILMLASSYNEKREDSIKDKTTAGENLLQPYRKY
jgi:uncharacterized phiE125 gp8 family phage protein